MISFASHTAIRSHTSLTLGLARLLKQARAQAPHFSQQLQRLRHAAPQGLSTRARSTQQRVLTCSESLRVLPETSHHHSSLAESVSHLLSVYTSEPLSPQLPAVQAYLRGTKLGSTKRTGKGKKKMQ